jgi:hypothetical protein
MAPGAVPERVIEVPVRTLDDILGEARAPVRFDLLSIDVEGHELEVLSGFDLARWQPRLRLLEDHVRNLAKHRFLKASGYRLIRRFENNGWYVPRDASIVVAPRERWEIVRKYYLALPFRMMRNASRAVRRRVRRMRGMTVRNRARPRACVIHFRFPPEQTSPMAAKPPDGATGRLQAPTSPAFPRSAWVTVERAFEILHVAEGFLLRKDDLHILRDDPPVIRRRRVGRRIGCSRPPRPSFHAADSAR